MLDPGHGKKIMNLRNTFKAYCCVLFSCACLINSSSAQDFPEDEDLLLLYGDEETISIATGSSKPLRLAPSVASVITADDIRTMGARDLDDILETIPGVHVSLSTRYSSLVSIRGIHTTNNPQVLILLNGYPITELFAGARAPTFQLPIHNIDRVEVIRGPGSAVFGADAFAGVINIITNSAAENQGLEGGVGIGSFDTYSTWLNFGSQSGELNFGFNLEFIKSDGDDDRIAESDAQTGLDGFFGTNASLAPGSVSTHYDIVNSQIELSKGRWKARLNSWIQDEAGIGAGVAMALDPNGYQSVDQHLLDISYKIDSNDADWSHEIRVNYFYMKQETSFNLLPAGSTVLIRADGNLALNPANAVGQVTFTNGAIGTPSGKDSNASFEFVSHYEGFGGHQIRFATGYKKQIAEANESKNFGPGVIDGTVPVISGALTDVTGTPFIYLQDQDRSVKHISLQDEWSFLPDWELTAGIRFDDYSDFGSTANPRLALVWQTNYNLTSKLLYGRAFRAPSFGEQFAINNPVIIGNNRIEPEEIDTIELSFVYRPFYDLDVQLNIFKYEIDGLINFIDDDGIFGGSKTARNAFDQKGKGVELEAEWRIGNSISLQGNIAYQDSEDKNTGDTVADAPAKQIFIGLNWQVTNDWTLNAGLHSVIDRVRTATDSRNDIDNNTYVNLTITSGKLFKALDFSLSIQNIFNEDLYEPSDGAVPNDNPLAARAVYLETQIYFFD